MIKMAYMIDRLWIVVLWSFDNVGCASVINEGWKDGVLLFNRFHDANFSNPQELLSSQSNAP